MNKKKITLTILLSALLALSVAFCVLKFSKKPIPIEAPIQPKVEVQAEIPANTGDNKTVKKDAEILPSTTKKAVTAPKPSKQTVKKVLLPKGFGGKDSWKGNRQGSLSLKSTTF